MLLINTTDSFCLPLYSHNNTGLEGKKAEPIHEYICVQNVGTRTLRTRTLSWCPWRLWAVIGRLLLVRGCICVAAGRWMRWRIFGLWGS